MRRGRKERVGRLLADARQQAPGDRRGVRRRHRRRGRPQVGRPPATRSAIRAIRSLLESIAVPGAGDLDRDRAEDQGRHGAPRPSRSSGSRRRIRPSASPRIPRRARRSSPGMGELHLEIISDRLLREFKVGANVGPPQVSYKETITQARARRGSLHQADRRLGRLRRRDARGRAGRAGQGLRVRRTRTKGAPIPREYVPAVRQGCEEALAERRARGLSRSSTCASRLVDGQAHDVDSSERSFKIAGSLAVREALREAQPGPARADHEASRSSRPTTSWARCRAT